MSTLSFTGDFPILRHPLDLGGYHPDLKGNVVNVWLNLSDDFQGRWRAYNAEVRALIEVHKAEIEACKAKVRTPDEREGNSDVADPGPDWPDALDRTRAELFTELWNLDVAEVTALFNESKAVGLRAWMRRRTWEIIEEYATGRGEAGGS